MWYLFLAIACSAAIALVFKYSETSGLNRYAVTTVNYLTATVTGIVLVTIRLGGAGEPLRFDLSGLLPVLGGGGVVTSATSVTWGILVGLVAGVFFFLAFIYYQKSVKEHGVGLAGTFAKLGILVPMSLSLLLWREFPTPVQWCGIVLAVASLALVNRPGRSKTVFALRLALLLLFLFGGLAEFSNKLFQRYALQDDKAFFLLTTFFGAFLLSLILTLRSKRRVTSRDFRTGIAVGLPNIFSSFFLIRALDSIPAAVAFPAYGAGTIVIINLVGAWVWKERLDWRDRMVVVLSVLALILINL